MGFKKMRWKILFAITLLSTIILFILYYRQIYCKNTFLFFGENENWRVVYTEIKKGNSLYDSISIQYKNARDANGELTNEAKKLGKIRCDITGDVPLKGFTMYENFTGNYGVQNLTEVPKGEEWYNLNKVYALKILIKAESGWETLELIRADVKTVSYDDNKE